MIINCNFLSFSSSCPPARAHFQLAQSAYASGDIEASKNVHDNTATEVRNFDIILDHLLHFSSPLPRRANLICPCAHVYCMLMVLGACNPIVCPIYIVRPTTRTASSSKPRCSAVSTASSPLSLLWPQ